MAKGKAAIPEDVLERFDKLVAGIKGVERKGATMPYVSLNGHMFAFIDRGGSLGLRLDTDDRESFLKKYQTKLCVAHGIVLKEYVSVPDSLFGKTPELLPWFKSAYAYVKTQKPKSTKKK